MTLNLPAALPLLEPEAALARTDRHTQDLPVAQHTPGVLGAGARFGKYTIRACVGEGGMARVYSAEHEELKRPVALKVLIDGPDSEQGNHQRFLREACLAAAIKHPNVVNIFDVGVHQGTPYLVMELLEGMDLEALVRARGRLDEVTLIDILVPIVAGLAAVHDAGIVHRDLKPSNIFLARGRDDEMEPRLLDFGISKSLEVDDLKLTAARGLLLGTPFYMAPEGVNGNELTPLSDQYGLGVVLYECATGFNPFADASSFSDVVKRVALGQLPAVASQNPELSPRLVAIIERAMQLDPARRFPDVRTLGRELLLLAGQRTRVAWNLSFTVLSARDAQARALTPASATSVSDAPPQKRTRVVRWLPWAALAVAALSPSWASSPKAEPSESAPRSKSGDVPAAPVVAPPAERARQPGNPAETSPPTEKVLTLAPKPTALRSPAPPRTEPQPGRPPLPARRATPAALEPGPSPALTKPPSGPRFGTNHAPIFD